MQAANSSASPPGTVQRTEDVLARRLTPRQLSMIALGGAIGTGLFLGSSVAVRLAGPGVVVSYILGGAIALLMARTLAEMAVVHPVAGSFGVYAEIYLNPWAGFTMRYSYWLAQVIANGSEVVAAAIYMNYWFPRVPGWLWVATFSLLLVAANAWSVSSFGEFEYWFAMIKVATIVLFLVVGTGLIVGIGPTHPVGLTNYFGRGGFFPHGLKGVLLATTLAVFSYFGIEVVAVTAGEARDPERTIPRAMRSVIWRLALFYIGSIALLVGLVPWTKVGLEASPFVRAFEAVHLPAAPGIMNFVVLTAALSSANTNTYMTTRMLFSLSRSGYAPARLGSLTRRGIPWWALLVSSAGMVAAAFALKLFPERAYLYLIGAAFFGALYVWMMILVTHLKFRPALHRMVQGPAHRDGTLRQAQGAGPAFPLLTWLGIVALAGVGVCTLFVPGLWITLAGGLPWLGLVSGGYWVWKRVNARKALSGSAS